MLNERKSWSQSEDQLLAEIYAKYKQQIELHVLNWNNVADQFNSYHMGQIRTGKQCRQRWFNQLDPKIRKSNLWSQQEKSYLLQLHNIYGNKWSVIAKFLNGRTDNSVKNFINSTLRKGLRLLNLYLSKNKKFTNFQFKNLKQYKTELLAKILLFSGDLENYHNQEYTIFLNNEQKNERETLKTVYNLSKSIKSQLIFLEDDYLKEKITFSSKKSYQPVQKFQLIIKNIQKLNSLCKKKKQKRNSVNSSDFKINQDESYSISNNEISNQYEDSLVSKSASQNLLTKRNKEIQKPINLIDYQITSTSAKLNSKQRKSSILPLNEQHPLKKNYSHKILVQKEEQQKTLRNQNITTFNNYVNQNGDKKSGKIITEKINNQCQNNIEESFCLMAENTAIERLFHPEEGNCEQEYDWKTCFKTSSTKTKKITFRDTIKCKGSIIEDPNIWVETLASPYQIPMLASTYLASEDDYFLSNDYMMEENPPLYPVGVQYSQKITKYSFENSDFNYPNILCQMSEDEDAI